MMNRAEKQEDSSVGMLDTIGEPEPRSFFTARTSVSGPAKYKQKWRRKYVAISFKFFPYFFHFAAIDFCEYENYKFLILFSVLEGCRIQKISISIFKRIYLIDSFVSELKLSRIF